MGIVSFLIRASSVFCERYYDKIHQNMAILAALLVVVVVAVA